MMNIYSQLIATLGHILDKRGKKNSQILLTQSAQDQNLYFELSEVRAKRR